MKLQLEGQKLRVRIDEDELGRLLAGDGLESRTQFADLFAIRCALQIASVNRAELTGDVGHWQIVLPAMDVRAHATRLPARDGLRYRIEGTSSPQTLELLFDVDVRDSVKRRR